MEHKTRDTLVSIRMTPDEIAMMAELADADGVYRSDVVRLLVRHAHTARFGGRPPKAIKRTTRK